MNFIGCGFHRSRKQYSSKNKFKIKERTELEELLLNGETLSKLQNDEQYAKDALKLFYKKLKDTKSEVKYITGFNGMHCSYVYLLMRVKTAFINCDFIGACHELHNIVHFEDVFQSRIKMNILKLLRRYIEVE